MTIAKKIILLFSIQLFSFCFSFAQNSVYKQYHTEDGLPSMEVYDIIQDSKGYIWVATVKGVSRFDGNTFENFTVENGLPDNEILFLREDKKGRIWFISFTGPLSYFDGTIHNSSNTSFLKKLEFNQSIKSFIPLPSGDVVLSTRNNINYYLKDTTFQLFDTISRKPKIDFKSDNVISTYNVLTNTYLTAKDSRIYITKNGQEYLIANSGFYKDEHPRFISTDREGANWLAANDGCYRFFIDKNNQLTSVQKYFEGFVINGVYEDMNHNFWFATRGEGLLMSPALNIRLFDKSSGLSDNNVSTAVMKEDGSIICGTQNGTIHTISKENKVVSSTNLQSLSIKKIINDKAGNTWIACEWNIFEMDKILNKKTPNLNCPYKTITLANDGSILAGGIARVFKISSKNADALFNLYKTIRFYSICETKNGELYLGTEKGLYVFKADNPKPFHHERKPFAGWIDDISKTKDGRILVTTRDSGLAVINKKEIEFYNSSNGLQSNYSVGVFSDTMTNKIYLATNLGLSIINLNAKSNAVKNFNAANGLLCGTIYSVYENNGEILLGTDKGLLRFTESDLKSSGEILKVYISRIEINNKDSALKRNYLLLPNQNNIKITFRGIAFNKPKSLEYRYKLLPIDSGWNATSTGTIIYSSLPSGKYKFIVQVRTDDKSWENGEAGFEFEIKKPVYLKWWFITLEIIFLLIIIQYINHRRYLRRTRIGIP